MSYTGVTDRIWKLGSKLLVISQSGSENMSFGTRSDYRSIFSTGGYKMSYLRYLSKRFKSGLMPTPLLGRFARPDTIMTPAIMADLVAATSQMKPEGLERRLNFISKIFVPDHYRTIANLSDATTDLDAFVHFMKYGLPAGASPTPLFDPTFYDQVTKSSRVVARGNESAFVHWLEYGYAAKIVPTPLFDDRYYLATNPDVASAKIWGFEHFITSGMEEGREPHPWFDSAWCGKFEG
jgi:hypothetical protein